MFGTVAGVDEVKVREITLHTPMLEAPAGSEVAVSIQASEIILAVGEPSPSSARNVLSGQVTGLTTAREAVLATVDVGFFLDCRVDATFCYGPWHQGGETSAPDIQGIKCRRQ